MSDSTRKGGPLSGDDPAESVPVVDSERLFCGGRQLMIDHHGDRYVLRITRQNKLILNK